MNYPNVKFTALLVIVPSVAFSNTATTTIFKDAGDVSNLALGTSTNAVIAVVDAASTPVASRLDGDALNFLDTSTGFLATASYQAGTGVADALKVSFDVEIDSISSNIVFRMGPSAGALGGLTGSTLGIQITNTGSVVAEQGVTVGGANSNKTYASSFSTANRFNVTIFYNDSDAVMDLSGYAGPADLAAKQWALYVDGVLKSGALSERYVHDLGSDFGFSWRAGTTANTPSVSFQLDNIEFTNISAIPEPSSFASLVGVGVIGFVAVRRRRGGRA